MKISQNMFLHSNVNQSLHNNVKQKDFNAQMDIKSDEINSVGELTPQQKSYLRNKYDLEDLNFNFDRPGNEAAMKAFKTESFDFMKDLLQMNLISQEEYDKYLLPSMPAISLPNYNENLLSDSKLEELRILRSNPSGNNLLDAFKSLTVQQSFRSNQALGKEQQEALANEAKMYDRLAHLLEEIFL